MTAKLILNFNSTEEFAPILKLLKEIGLDKNISISIKSKKINEPPLKPRKAGCGKSLFNKISLDFDEILPGFEPYLLIDNH